MKFHYMSTIEFTALLVPVLKFPGNRVQFYIPYFSYGNNVSYDRVQSNFGGNLLGLDFHLC